MADSLTRADLSVLLRIVGSRTGADLEAIQSFESSHHRQRRTPEQIRESVARLANAQLIVQQGNRYLGTPQVQAAFLEECRNCRDTIEEFDILNRIIAQFGKTNLEGELSASEESDRWRKL